MRRFALAFALTLAGAPGAYAQQHPLPFPTTNNSGTITAGNTFQQILAAGTRQSITIQNNNTNGDNCWVFLGTTANATRPTAILLAPGGSYQRYYPYVPNDPIQITCANTLDTFYADSN